jgi:hypothetical protein
MNIATQYRKKYTLTIVMQNLINFLTRNHNKPINRVYSEIFRT